MKRLLLTGIPSLTIIIINILFGGVISWMLSIILIACLLFFVTKLGLENIITRRMQALQAGDERIGKLVTFDQKWKSILNFSLLTVVFLTTVGGVYFTMSPKGVYPWFTNNEYHGLSNTGIAFNQNLEVTPIVEDSSNLNANIRFSKSTAEAVKIDFNNFFEPVILVNQEGLNQQLNRIFDTDVSKGFTIKSGLSSIQVEIEEKNNNIFKRLFGARKTIVNYKIKVQSSDPELLEDLNLSGTFSDEINLSGLPLSKGMNLFNLFLDNKTFSSTKNESYQVLESILSDLGDTYLLANNENDKKTYTIFPDKPFLDNGYQLLVNGALVAPKVSNSAAIPNNAAFYIGFNNQKKKLHIGEIDNALYNLKGGRKLALIFDYPNTYMLKSP